MFSVPEVIMCFHIDGIVQNYEHIKTDDIPKVAGFNPDLIKDTAKSIMSFLNSNCTGMYVTWVCGYKVLFYKIKL